MNEFKKLNTQINKNSSITSLIAKKHLKIDFKSFPFFKLI